MLVLCRRSWSGQIGEGEEGLLQPVLHKYAFKWLRFGVIVRESRAGQLAIDFRRPQHVGHVLSIDNINRTRPAK